MALLLLLLGSALCAAQVFETPLDSVSSLWSPAPAPVLHDAAIVVSFPSRRSGGLPAAGRVALRMLGVAGLAAFSAWLPVSSGVAAASTLPPRIRIPPRRSSGVAGARF